MSATRNNPPADAAEQSALDFPCDFPIKMMGRDTADFRAAARDIVERHAGPVADSALREALSRNANFVSITITINAGSQAQLDAIYEDLTDDEHILVAL